MTPRRKISFCPGYLALYQTKFLYMNIVFCSMDDSENYGLQATITKKLRDMHRLYPNMCGAQVNFSKEQDKAGADKVCEIDLTHYGEPVSVRKQAANYELAAYEAVAGLTRKLGKSARSVPS
jgi:ribosome-associated translation inhibitor RaiA